MLTITFQIPPPLNSSGVVLIRVQISASLSFQVCRAEFRLSTIQFPLPNHFTSHTGCILCCSHSFLTHAWKRAVGVFVFLPHQPVMRVRISLVKVITIPPAMVSIPLAR